MEIFNKDFCIHQIADSGQCFRMSRTAEDTWTVIAKNNRVDVQKLPNGAHVFKCTDDDYWNIWHDYFDLDTDYNSIKQLINTHGDEYLSEAVSFGYGIRILRQDIWETLISFVISQQNNIPRIKSIISRLSASSNNDFPTASQLSSYSLEELREFGLGYRAEYIYDISRRVSGGMIHLDDLKNLSYSEAIRALMTLRGVGVKVANCTALFGLHFTEAFPIDVWMKKIIQRHYNGHFDYQKFGKIAGIVQQYMYFYERSVILKK